jgi:hypothetical protein
VILADKARIPSFKANIIANVTGTRISNNGIAAFHPAAFKCDVDNINTMPANETQMELAIKRLRQTIINIFGNFARYDRQF